MTLDGAGLVRHMSLALALEPEHAAQTAIRASADVSCAAGAQIRRRRRCQCYERYRCESSGCFGAGRMMETSWRCERPGLGQRSTLTRQQRHDEGRNPMRATKRKQQEEKRKAKRWRRSLHVVTANARPASSYRAAKRNARRSV